MMISVWLGAVLFFFGTSVGALLLVGFQWTAFKQRALRETMAELQAAAYVKREPIAFGRLNATHFTATCADYSHPATAIGEHVSLGANTDLVVETLLEQKQLEVNRTRRQIQTLRAAIPL
jgi:hypothetical protein